MLFQAGEPIRLHFEGGGTFTYAFVIALAPIALLIRWALRLRKMRGASRIAAEAYRQVKETHFATPSSPESPGTPGAPASPGEIPAGSSDATHVR